MSFIDELKDIQKNSSYIEDSQITYHHIIELWKNRIEQFSVAKHQLIKSNLKKEVERGNIKKHFLKKPYVETKIFWGGRSFANESKAILEDILQENPIYREAFEQVMRMNKNKKRKNTNIDFNNDICICNRILELCNLDGIQAEYTSENDIDYGYNKYTIIAKIILK